MPGTRLCSKDAKDKEDVSSTLKLPAICYAKPIPDWHPIVHFSIKIRSIYSAGISQERVCVCVHSWGVMVVLVASFCSLLYPLNLVQYLVHSIYSVNI